MLNSSGLTSWLAAKKPAAPRSRATSESRCEEIRSRVSSTWVSKREVSRLRAVTKKSAVLAAVRRSEAASTVIGARIERLERGRGATCREAQIAPNSRGAPVLGRQIQDSGQVACGE